MIATEVIFNSSCGLYLCLKKDQHMLGLALLAGTFENLVAFLFLSLTFFSYGLMKKIKMEIIID